MSKILVVGTGPLFAPEVKLFNGQAFRTWHFTKPLRDAGHSVDLVVFPQEGAPLDQKEDSLVTAARRDTFKYSIVNTTEPNTALKVLQEIHDRTPYNAIVAVNNNAAAIACRLQTRLPMWVDLFGYIMGEAQSKCKVYNSDDYLRHFWQRERIALRRGDRFSVVSYKQMYATLGELATLGRLGQLMTTYPLVTVVPTAAYEEFSDPKSYPTEKKYRGKLFPEDAFAVLWSGTFNTWSDVRTLAAALSLAMEQDGRIHFVATGGAVPGHDDVTYNTFLSEMEKTGFKDRCHLLGWIEAKELFPLYRECDLGVNIDALNYETLFGARNRLTNLMAAGLPILTTLGTEITEIIEENNLGYVVRIGRVQEYSDAILRAAKRPSERKDFAARARAFCRENYSYEATSKALVKWAAAPTSAPDNAEKLKNDPELKNPAFVALNGLEEEARIAQEADIIELAKARVELDEMRGKASFRMYRKIFT